MNYLHMLVSNHDPRFSASQVTRITGMSHQCPSHTPFLNLTSVPILPLFHPVYLLIQDETNRKAANLGNERSPTGIEKLYHKITH
jgi:hypothetical protein